MLTKEIRDAIDAGAGDTKLASLLSNDRVTITRHQARKMIAMYQEERLAKASNLKAPSNKYEAESREEWFIRAQAAIERRFTEVGFPLPPKVRIGCGWPAGGKRSHAMGEAWKSEASGDETYEIFINPRLNTSQGNGAWIVPGMDQHHEGDATVIGVVWHELVHTALWHAGHDNHHHGADFKALAKDIGMVVVNRKGGTKLTEEGLARANEVLSEIGPYPMAPMTLQTSAKKTQTTRMLKLVDPENSEYQIRMTREPISIHGLPKSPTGKPMLVELLSLMRTEHTPDDLVALSYATKDSKGGLTLTEAGEDEARELLERLLGGE